jgi:hypothetical protein
MFRSAILSLGLAAFVLSLTGCGSGSEQPRASAPADQEKARGGPKERPGAGGTSGSQK